jgi:tripartite-type tricarboxylate transporter receptor subunit TctC
VKLPRRNFMHLAAGAAALPAVAHIAWAQTYPSRPVHVIVPFAPAGDTDLAARLMGQWLSERLGQPFIIENQPGAGTNIGTEAVVRAPADGYTLLLASPPAAINATLYEKLNFNFIRDIAPVAGGVCWSGTVWPLLWLHLDMSNDTLPDFVCAVFHTGGGCLEKR